MTPPRSSVLASVPVLAACCALIGVTAFHVLGKFLPHQYWDQWAFTSFVSREPGWGAILWDLVKPHNEHIILTSKVLFWADYLLFDLTNALTVTVVNLAIIGTCVLLAFTAFPERLGRAGRTVLVVACVAAGWTLSQWENLIWGFQPQFILALLFGLLAIRASVAWLDADSRAPSATRAPLAAQMLFVALAALSLSSGVLLFLALGLVAVARRASPGKALAVVGPSVLLFGLYLWWTFPRDVIGEPKLRTAGNLLRFLLAILGFPVADADTDAAQVVGGVFLVAALLWFAYGIVLPWWRRRPIDTPTLVLGAFGIFVLAGLLGIAWGRTPLGPVAARASRYCTPTLMLWLCVLLSWFRHAWLRLRGTTATRFAVPAAACGLLLLGWVSGPQPRHLLNLDVRYRHVVQSTYFVLSGVWSMDMIRPTYPDPAEIPPLLTYMRRHGLGIFSARSTLPMPDWSLLLAMNWIGTMDWCNRYSIDVVYRLGDDGWKVNGWAQDPDTFEAPAWLLAFDGHGRLRGFTPPMTERPDLERPLNAPQGMRGFSLPVGPASGDDEASRTISMVAGFKQHRGFCRMEYRVRLPGPGENTPPPVERGPV